VANASKELEHLDPSVAARLEEEGVADADARISRLVDEFVPTAGVNQWAVVIAAFCAVIAIGIFVTAMGVLGGLL
jgi:hypothetical protein